jgi:hypothetical protein
VQPLHQDGHYVALRYRSDDSTHELNLPLLTGWPAPGPHVVCQCASNHAWAANPLRVSEIWVRDRGLPLELGSKRLPPAMT